MIDAIGTMLLIYGIAIAIAYLFDRLTRDQDGKINQAVPDEEKPSPV